ncbi:MAG: hypothetical protein ABJA66_16055 [Actinomycetota bacterium]
MKQATDNTIRGKSVAIFDSFDDYRVFYAALTHGAVCCRHLRLLGWQGNY